MKTTIFTIIILFLLGCNSEKTMNIKAPIAEKVSHILEKFSDTRIDNYYWIRLSDEQKKNKIPDEQTKKVVKYLNDENSYTNSMLKSTEKLQETLYNEMVSRIVQDDESVPYKENGYYYYSRYETGKEYPIYCRKKDSLSNPEEILLNVNILAEGKAYCEVANYSISPNNKFMAYGLDTVSRRQYTIYFKNLETGETLTENITNTTGSAVWANNNKTIFYSVKDETLRPYKIFRHTLKQQNSDKEVYCENDATFVTYVYRSKSNQYIIIGSSSTLSSEYRYLSANTPNKSFKVFQPRQKDLEYGIYHYKDHFYIRTNLNAKNFQLMKTSISKTEKSNWETVIEHRKDVLLQDIDIFKNYLVVSERKNGLTQIRVINWANNNEYYLNFDSDTYVANTTTNIDFDSQQLRYSFSSLTKPRSLYDFNLVTKEKTLLKQQKILGGYNEQGYASERLYAEGRDGTIIPISLVYKKSLKNESSNPLLLYAYGSYGYSTEDYFSSHRLSLLDRGYIFAIAHVRGGQEMGRQWYDDGKLLKKKNTFYDFIDCGKYLISNNYTDKNKLFAMGGSAGGLLVGAVINIEPSIFKGAIAAVPFVDVVTTMLDESIPLTTGEYDEWGNPNNKEYYNYMLSYSPYDQVKAQNYPALLITTGFHDSQVQYWEPAKWIAKLRDMRTNNNLLLLHTNMDFGHGGASGRFEYYKDVALQYAFMFHLLDIKE